MKNSFPMIAIVVISIQFSCASRISKSPVGEETIAVTVEQPSFVIPTPSSDLVEISAKQRELLAAQFVGPEENLVTAFGPGSETESGRPWDLGQAGYKFHEAQGESWDLAYSGFRLAIVTSSNHRGNEELSAVEFLEHVRTIGGVVEGEIEERIHFERLLRGYFGTGVTIDYSGAMNYGTLFSGPDRYGFLVNIMAPSAKGPVSIACVFSVVFVDDQAITLKLFEGNSGTYVLERLTAIANEWTREILEANSLVSLK